MNQNQIHQTNFWYRFQILMERTDRRKVIPPPAYGEPCKLALCHSPWRENRFLIRPVELDTGDISHLMC